MKAKTALITGGAGFIGSHLAEILVKGGVKVTILDDLSTGSERNLVEIRNSIEFVKGSVLNKKLVDKLVKESDIVYHLAAVLGVSQIVKNPIYTMHTNFEGTRVLAQSCLKHQKKVIFASSSEAYGKSNKLPLTENEDIIFGNTTVSRWNYGISKAIGEHILFGYSKIGLSFSIVRLFNSYGPRCINKVYRHVIPKFIELALNNQDIPLLNRGNDTRTFTYVTDTVNGIILAGEKLQNDVVNIGSERKTKILHLAKLIVKNTGSHSKIVFISGEKMYGNGFEDIKSRVPNMIKAKSDLGFRPIVNLEEGVKRTIEWIKLYGKIG